MSGNDLLVGNGKGMDNSNPEVREWEGNEKKTFPKFENRKGVEKNIPEIREREGNEKSMPTNREREGNEKTLPKALRTQALTALTRNFGLVGLVQYA